MQYTQLPFSRLNTQNLTVSEQAQSLLHELVKGRSHNHPCDCGACIYAAYRAGAKAEGRSFSKRTFFVFFLQNGIMQLILCKRAHADISIKRVRADIYDMNRRLKAEDRLREESRRRTLDNIWLFGSKGEFVSRSEVYKNQVEAITRKGVLTVIKRLAKKEKSQHARAFLNGILNKKCFYTYYKRAEDPRIYDLVKKIRGLPIPELSQSEEKPILLEFEKDDAIDPLDGNPFLDWD